MVLLQREHGMRRALRWYEYGNVFIYEYELRDFIFEPTTRHSISFVHRFTVGRNILRILRYLNRGSKLARSSNFCCKFHDLNIYGALQITNTRMNFEKFCCISVNVPKVFRIQVENSLVAASMLGKFRCTSHNLPKAHFYHILSPRSYTPSMVNLTLHISIS
jgi:hypothetical protein